jgi:AAA ATPase domain
MRPVLSAPISQDGREEVVPKMEARLEAQHCGSPFIDGPFDLLSVSFTGREMQLDQLGQWLKPSASNTSLRCLVHGMPGVGKSQLALQFAQNVFESKE